MRPIKLEISAFGSYAGNSVLNMDELEKRGLYLITGDTGAGKTTIFDAVCYALYGKTSGEYRGDGKVLRSELATDDMPTSVRLQFEHNGKEYEVFRSMEYERAKKHGEGTTTQKEKTELTLPDGAVHEKKTIVNQKVCEILGIEYENFIKIMMIAQGDFMKLLMAETDKRSEILRKIFDTRIYADLEEKLKRRAKDAEDAYNELKRDIESEQKRIDCPPDHPMHDDVALRGNVHQVDELMMFIDRLIEHDWSRHKEAQTLEAEQGAKLEALTIEITTADNINKRLAELTKAMVQVESDVQSGNDELPKLLEKQQELGGQREEFDEKKKKYTQIEMQLPKHRDLFALNASIRNLEAQREGRKKKLVQMRSDFEAGKLLIQQLRASENALQSAPLELQRAQDALGVITKRKTDLTRFQRGAQDLRLKGKELLLAQVKAGDAVKLSEDEAKRSSELQSAFLRGQAGIMAEHLAPSQPCPVCGSTEHPHPAIKAAGAPTEREVEEVKKKAESALSGAHELSRKAGELKSVLSERTVAASQRLSEIVPEADGVTGLDEMEAIVYRAMKDVDEAHKSAESAERMWSQKDKEFRALRPKIDQQEKLQSTLSQSIQDEEKLLSNDEGAFAEKKIQSEQLQKELTHPDAQSAEREIKSLQAEYSKWDRDLKDYDEKLRKVRERLKSAEGQKKLLDEQMRQVKGQPVADTETLYERKRTLEDGLRKCREENAQLLTRIQKNRDCKERIGRDAGNFEKERKKLELAKHLSDIAGGRSKGNDVGRLTFENYILSDYFERVLHQANHRFGRMSGGQYELVRTDSTEDKRMKAGFDLNVVNHHTGKERSVRSLSGGESFMASLSLALGFADVIRHHKGGIVLDCMFVDEGFGSLDERSLEQVMDALMQLTEGEKLVGIISHVQELKQRIPKRIIVTKDARGSKARIETDN